MVEKATKFVWAYVLEKGKLTDGEWNNYYGDWDSIHHSGDCRDAKWDGDAKQKVLAKVKEVGIDWEKSGLPKSSMQNQFEDTESPDSSVAALLGKLVLKDGSSFKFGLNNLEIRFSDYAKSLAEFMQDKQKIYDILGEEI